MTKIFKKTLLATALLAAAGVANAASVVQFTPTGLSKQASNALTINGPQFNIDNGVQYAIGTEIVVTFSAGELSVAPTASVYSVTTAQAAGAVAGAPVLVGGAEFERISQTPTSATFRLKGAVVPANVIRDEESAAGALDGTDGVQYLVRVDGYQFTRASALAQDSISATVLVKADTGVAIDAAGTGDKLTRNVLLVGDQFASAVSPAGGFAKEISLASVRTKFTGTNPADRTFTLQVDTANRTGVAYKNDAGANVVAPFSASATVGTNAYKYTVNGDFSWIADKSTAAKAGITPSAGCSIAAGAITASSIVFTCNGLVGTSNNSLTFNVFQGGTKAPAALQDGVYTASAEVNFTSPTGTFVTLTNAKAGEFTNDGTTVAVNYLPFGPGISQILYVTNKTGQVGKIYATAYDQAGTKLLDGVEVGTTVPNGLTQVAGEVRAALGDSYEGRVAVTFDIESSEAVVFSAYNVNGDRLATK